MPAQRINYYDSMGGAGRSVTRALLMWLEDEDDDKNKDNATFDPDEWTLAGTSLNETPQQVGTDVIIRVQPFPSLTC